MRRSISICITLLAFAGLCIPGSGFSQVSKVDFTWLNRSEQVLAGTVEARLIPRQEQGSFEVEFRVAWFDEKGVLIPETAPRPVLYLSRFALDLHPAGSWECTSFSPSGATEVAFGVSAKLAFQPVGRQAGPLELRCTFQYALSEDHYRKGALEKIGLPEGKTAIFRFPAIQQPTGLADAELGGKPSGRDLAPHPGMATYRILMAQHGNYQAQVKDLQRRKENENITDRIRKLSQEPNRDSQQAKTEEILRLTQLFLADLDYLVSGFNSIRPVNLTDSLPADTARAVANRFDRLSDELLSLRTDYNQYNLMVRALQPGGDDLVRAGITDSLRKSARRTYLGLFRQHQDTLSLLALRLDSLKETIVPAARKPKLRERETARLEAQQFQLEIIQADFNRLKLVHQQSVLDYRSLTFGVGSIIEVETLHQDYSSRQVATENTLMEADNLLRDYRARISKPAGQTPGWFTWVAALAMFVIILFVVIRLFRSRRPGPASPEPPFQAATPGIHSGNGTRSGLETPINFFTTDYTQTITEVIIARIHFSPVAITALYQLVHGAFLEKRPGSFGGYLFGNSYRLAVEGSSKYELVIEKVAGSALMRPEMPNTMESRQELVDEMDEQIRSNRKLTLLGWFTSCSDPALEMNEGLQKIHRTFFDQKSQIAILVNAGSEELKTACFLRRKSGYFDPIPDPGAILKWEDLYRFSQSPVVQSSDNQSAKSALQFIPLALNEGWCDSIVGRVNLEKGTLAEMRHASSLLSSPAESYQVVGYLYGTVHAGINEAKENQTFTVDVERFIELTNETTPRVIPGLSLLGWLGQGTSEIFSYARAAIHYHDQYFKEPYQVAFLLNSGTAEFRILSRKQNLTMNDSSIDTEEFNFNLLLGESQ
ncbi:MAG: hypothetical protein R6V75_05290 [Bacteroidales bacterium]